MNKTVLIVGSILVLGTGVFFAIKTYKTKQQQNGTEMPAFSNVQFYVDGTARVDVYYKGNTKVVRANYTGAVDNKIGDFEVRFKKKPDGKTYDQVSLYNKNGIEVFSTKG